MDEYYAVRLHFNDMLMVATTSKLRNNIVRHDYKDESNYPQFVSNILDCFSQARLGVWRGWQDMFVT